MNETTAPGHSNQTAIIADRRILDGPIAGDVERRDLRQKEKVILTYCGQDETLTLIDCHTSDSGFIILISG